MSAGTKAEQSTNDETQVPSANAIGNTNVMRSPFSPVFCPVFSPTELKNDITKIISEFSYQIIYKSL
jgi:hypothetical protein